MNKQEFVTYATGSNQAATYSKKLTLEKNNEILYLEDLSNSDNSTYETGT